MSFDFTKQVTITPTGEADQRTKNRISEHSLVPARLGKGEEIPASKFFQSMGDSSLFSCRDCDWRGWLPNNQFKMET